MKNIVYIFLISMLPLIELRGAVPVGAALEVPFYTNYIAAVIGNILPIPFILLFIPKILDFLGRFRPFAPIVDWLKKKADKHSAKILKGPVGDGKVRRFRLDGTFFGLLFFVMLPIPGTGAWSGALVAALFRLPRLYSFIAILIGVLLCGVIMVLASYGVVGFLSFLAS